MRIVQLNNASRCGCRIRPERESRKKRERSRRCDRGRNPRSHCSGEPGWEGAGSREIREPEDLPTLVLMIPFEDRGEGYRAKETGCSPQRFSLRAFLVINAKVTNVRVIIITDMPYRAWGEWVSLPPIPHATHPEARLSKDAIIAPGLR
jgi:hypothetical protein